MFHFPILVSVGLWRCSLVWYTSKHGTAHNSMLKSWHLYFVHVSLFLAKRTWHWILLHCMSQCLLCLESSPFSWLMDSAHLLCFAIWGQGTLPTSCIRSLSNVSLNCQHDNFKPQEARMIKLLRMVRYRIWKNSSYVHFPGCLLIQ